MNNKGFAISTMLYGLVIIIVLVMVSILSIMEFNRKVSAEFTSEIRDELENKKTGFDDFINAYTYNQTSGAANYCITGNESTCVKTECYKNKAVNSCKAGDIIDYKVNDSETVRFHVMYDDENTITMQAQRNTVKNVAWHSGNNIVSQGPDTIVAALKLKTNSWNNVNDQTYTMGTTIFKTNAYTSCNATSCANNKYTWSTRTDKARMITIQEANFLGCTFSNNSCPIWMHNYLDYSKYGGAPEEDRTTEVTECRGFEQRNASYWTMSASERLLSDYDYSGETSTKSYHAWYITSYGFVNDNVQVTYCGTGARAVVQVSKS